MTQRKSSEERVHARAIGRRIRILRGAASQADFANAFGLTRSALANYELGRSKPPREFLDQIKDRTGHEVDADPELTDYEDEFKSLLGDGSQLTDDEWAVVRILRVTSSDDVRDLLQAMVEKVELRGSGLRFADPQTAALDLARLITVADGKRQYIHGTSGQTAIQVARVLAASVKT